MSPFPKLSRQPGATARPIGAKSAAGAPLTPARLAATLGGRLPPAGARIGLLGGSFNPAHAGHRQLSTEALKRLALDEVWWLVSPQNPLKAVDGMASLDDRLASARAAAKHPRIRVTAIEQSFGTTATVETLERLTHYFPRVRFVWLMGADNLHQISRWARWPQIFHRVAIAVFDRPSYSQRAVVAKAARRFRDSRIDERQARRLADLQPPAWAFVHMPLCPLSATALRTHPSAALGKVRRAAGG